MTKSMSMKLLEIPLMDPTL